LGPHWPVGCKDRDQERKHHYKKALPIHTLSYVT
jgi:hypothetical protein